MAPTERSIQLRIRVIGILFVGVFLAVSGRAGYLQLVMAEDLTARGDQQHQRVIKLTPQRGVIYDRNGDPLALSLEVQSLYANPSDLQDVPQVAHQLAPLLDSPERQIRKKLSEKKSFVWVERLLTPEVAKKITELKIPGLHFVPEHKRYYPHGQIAAQVVGFTGLDPRGLEGIELKYDADLQGEAGLLISERDARGRGMATAGQDIRGGVPGESLFLTIDRTLQYIAEKELAREVKQSGAVGGTVVMIEPASGRVLAMASQPSYNPNAINRYHPADWRNRVVSDSFEPGSIFKPFILSAIIQEQVLSPGSQVDCEHGRYEVGGKIIRDHKGYGRLRLSEMLKYSSNIGFAKLGKMLERERVYRYVSDFGFGAKTGIDLPGEQEGLLHPSKGWFEIDLATISFGQGISVTPMQMVTAMGAIANGGLLMKPYLVEKIVDGQGATVFSRQPHVVRRVISAATAKRVRQMMVGVTEEGGTGTKGVVEGFDVAGKTGTAQKIDPVTGTYSDEKMVASFIGMVPAENPVILLLVTIDEPQDKIYGGLVAAPVFSRIADEALRYLDVPPTTVVAKQTLPEQPPKIAGDKSVISEPQVTAGKGSSMPNFIGMSYRQVLEAMQRSGLNIKLSGSGKVVEQSPSAGAVVRYGAKIWVRFGA
ncbi:penicillin-binding protein [Geopsychrobacter electrodiphilus]|uniref:penicillin-binding protein n=1 Tax=Geopsychrobacter electrodiphilus TaxID=225196 RepID=UPI00035EE3E6|nr:penicillin-binding protein [Geopsychrobacter electrodiphilus]